mgnify:CR=1 FL=1
MLKNKIFSFAVAGILALGIGCGDDDDDDDTTDSDTPVVTVDSMQDKMTANNLNTAFRIAFSDGSAWAGPTVLTDTVWAIEWVHAEAVTGETPVAAGDKVAYLNYAITKWEEIAGFDAADRVVFTATTVHDDFGGAVGAEGQYAWVEADNYDNCYVGWLPGDDFGVDADPAPGIGWETGGPTAAYCECPTPNTGTAFNPAEAEFTSWTGWCTPIKDLCADNGTWADPGQCYVE